jgi:hypothetical protein
MNKRVKKLIMNVLDFVRDMVMEDRFGDFAISK